MNNIKNFLIAAMFAATASQTVAAETDADKIRARLTPLLQGHEVESVQESPLPGYYEVVVDGTVLYVSSDARYLIQGDIYDIDNGMENLTESRMDGLRKAEIDKVGDDQVVAFGPADAEHTISVFTDIDCGYCRKLHAEMDKYNEKGIRIRYLFFPRSGPGGEAFQKSVWVWCADDRQKAMTAAKKGEDIEQRECENPVLDHYALGRQLGVTGTPALVFDSGRLVPGYMPAERLKLMLDALKKEG